MNIKAEVFNKYLEEKEIKAFQVEEIADDAQHTVVYRSHIEVEGQQLPTLVLLDDSVFSMVRVLVASRALTAENELELQRLASEYNYEVQTLQAVF